MFCSFLQLFQPFSPSEKQCDKKIRNTGSQSSSSCQQEEQHLLETPGSSSSSLNNPSGSARVSVTNNNNEKKETERLPQQYSAAEGCKLHSCGDRHNSASSGKSLSKNLYWNVPEPLEIWLSVMSLFRSLYERIKHYAEHGFSRESIWLQQREYLVSFEKRKWLSCWPGIVETMLNGGKSYLQIRGSEWWYL